MKFDSLNKSMNLFSYNGFLLSNFFRAGEALQNFETPNQTPWHHSWFNYNNSALIIQNELMKTIIASANSH